MAQMSINHGSQKSRLLFKSIKMVESTLHDQDKKNGSCRTIKWFWCKNLINEEPHENKVYFKASNCHHECDKKSMTFYFIKHVLENLCNNPHRTCFLLNAAFVGRQPLTHTFIVRLFA